MRKLLPLLTLLLAVPLYAEHNRSQSYFTYEDGGTIVRQGEDQQEVEARVNFPVYPGDEVTTNRRGRAEIRLSDGNVLALDRSTQIRFTAIRDSYDGDASQTIIELRYGHVMLERDDDDRDPVRLDTEGASFAANERSIYAVEYDRGHQRVAVYDGSIEVRTPSRTTRVREGEEGRLDDQGLYDLVSLSRGGADDFERWFIRRAETYRGASSRYLDRSLAYSDYDLGSNGNWVYVNDYGSWCWRPHVSVGWRPYYNGYWHHGHGGSLVWISYEPWGWVPYHYGRWAYDPFNGWVWMPGYAYSPAWVYWMYGPGYIGWAPAGWYDCYRPYYGWAYRPYMRAGLGFGFGFYGRVRVHDIDLRPWTFVSPGHIVSTRVDHAALTMDAVRQRLSRDGGGFATVSGAPARFTRSELRDPASAVNNIRRGIGSGTGTRGSGSAADMTPFFRRDPELSTAVRDRIVRSRTADEGVASGFTRPRGVGAGVPSPGTGGTLEGRVPRDGGGSRRDADMREGTIQRGVGSGTIGGGVGDWRSNRPSTTTPPGTIRRGESGGTTTPTPSTATPPARDGAWRNRDNGGTTRRGVDRGGATVTPPDRSATPRPDDRNNVRRNREYSPWRDHVQEPPSSMTPPATTAPRNNDRSVTRENWRGRNSEASSRESVRPNVDRGSRGSDVPRRIIDGIGGARIYPGDRPSSSRGGDSGARSSPPPPPSRSSGGGERSSPPPRSHDGGSHSGSHDGGSHGNIKRN